MKILHVLRGLERASGISAFLVENANRQACAGHDVALLYERIFEYRPIDKVRVFQGKSPFGIRFRPDIVHVHAVWSFFSVMAMLWCFLNRIPYIVSPHGCLMPQVFKRGQIKKKLFYAIFVRPLLQRASALHATAQIEANALKCMALKPRLMITPLGVDLPACRFKDVKTKRNVLFMGRLSKEKGLLLLLNAWSKTRCDNWRLILAGPDWRGYKKILEKEVKRLSLQDSILFVGGVSGKAKENCYRGADIFILPSPMENFSSVVLEALSYAIPVIATKGTPWKLLEDEHCGWWIDYSLDSMITALSQAMRLSEDERKKMGLRGLEIVSERFSWESATTKMLSDYQQIIN